MSQHPPSADIMNAPTLDDFIAAAKAAGPDGEIRVELDTQGYRVLAVGHTPNGRDVSWVASPRADAIGLYLASFQERFGKRITDAVIANFGSDFKVGHPLSARTVNLAVEMADRSLTAMSGVDFLSCLHSSAVVNGAIFNASCEKLSINAASLSNEARKRIDKALQQRFQFALLNGGSPVAELSVAQWLEECLSKETTGSE